MRNKLIKMITFTFALFLVFTNSTKATDANAYGSGGYTGNTGTGCTLAGVACSIQNAHRIKVRLVYFDGKKEQIIAGPTEVAPDQWEWYTTGEEYQFSSANFEKKVVGNNNDPKEKKRQTLQKFIEEIGWNIKLNDLTKPSCEVDRKGNCYNKAGYRVIAELYIGLSRNAGDGIGTDYHSVKEAGMNNRYLDVPSRGDYRGSKMSNKMTIQWADIHYRCNGNGKGQGVCTKKQESLSCLLDPNCGYGIWIVDISAAIKNNHDYSLDIACENCDSKNADSKAMVIQDSTNWEAIKNSVDVGDERKCGDVLLKEYFKKTKDGTYCREEYHVYYPTYNKTTGKLRALLGRYFTVNATKDKLDVLDDNILNFAPIKVTKIRQCQGGNLQEYERNSYNDFVCGNGDITIDYKESKSGGYTYNDKLEPYNCKIDSSNIENGMLTLSRTCSYTLKPDVYQYINMSDGKSMKNIPSDFDRNKKYKNVGVSNLPVSFNKDAKAGETIATVQFQYDLPSCSNISKVYSNGGNCFNDNKNSKNKNNVYKKYKEKDTIDGDDIKNTACVKLYGSDKLGDANSDVEKCISDRQTNKFGDSGKSCIEKNKIGQGDNYVCDIAPNVCDTEEEAKIDKVAWNPEGNDGKGECCAPGEVYIPGRGCQNSGKPTPVPGDGGKPDPECVDDSGNMTDCGDHFKCDKDTKKCVPDEPENKCELLGCKDACCEGQNGNAYCGVKINNQIICAGKPTPISEELGVYRTIDPSSPFTNQNGVVRETGDNWCNTAVKNKSCSGDVSSYKNSVLKTVISDGNKTEENAIYKVTLDSKTINAIRSYNRTHSYDDFTLQCDSNGDNCKIKEFKEKTSINISGKCAISNSSSFESCRK